MCVHPASLTNTPKAADPYIPYSRIPVLRAVGDVWWGNRSAVGDWGSSEDEGWLDTFSLHVGQVMTGMKWMDQVHTTKYHEQASFL